VLWNEVLHDSIQITASVFCVAELPDIRTGFIARGRGCYIGVNTHTHTRM
jgi:hypothetical protein